MAEQFVPFIFVIIIVVMIFVINYNKFIKYKNRIEASWSHIDVALKRRFNLIPNLLKVVSQYQQHEAEVFEKTSRNFHSGVDNVVQRSAEESELSRSLGGILALVENYPELKASDNFLALQQSLSDIERDIMEARNRLNDNVARYNTLVEAYPTNLIAKAYGFEKYDYFTLELATQREVPPVDFDA
ncbi:MAG: LemA family protein [Sulfurimonas sp.]|nr:MAG: LemA family protein [Sulfurimonas sp.]